MTTDLKRDDYSVGWICAIPIELAAVLAILDETHSDPPLDIPAEDTNLYKFGKIGRHNVVISCLPEGRYGLTRAAVAATCMRSTFKRLRFGLMVGVGGGAPSDKNDIRLGDIVVSQPTGASSGVIQYDFGKAMENGEFLLTGSLNAPPLILLSAISAIKAISQAELGSRILDLTRKVDDTNPRFHYPGQDTDRLFRADYNHAADNGNEICASCDAAKVITRSERQYNYPDIHYGIIASANQVMKDGVKRDKISAQTGSLCFEMEAAGLMNDFPCLVIRGICDYSDGHKNKCWQPYAALVATIYAKELLLQIPAASNEKTENTAPTEDDLKCLQSLYTSDYESHKNRNPTRVAGTCEWFLGHERYMRWRQGQESCFLWVSGNPGCGKSVLSSFLVDELRSAESQATLPGTVCYFFFKDDNDTQKSASHALCALLHQLFTTKISLTKHAIPDFKNKSQNFTSEFGSLWRILLAAAASSDCGTVICVLDGLDECEESTRKLLLDSLVKLSSEYGEGNTKTSLKFIVVSRPDISIEKKFYTDQIIRLRTEDETSATDEDIERVIKASVKRLGSMRRLSDAVQASLEERLIKNADRTFIWVSLILEMIENSARASEKVLNKIISTIPTTLGAVYDGILQKSSDLEDTRKLLHIIVGATRPLTLEEMNIAFNIKRGDKWYEDIDLEPSMAGTIKSLCGSFVRIIDSKIYLVHQTAKEYLVSNPTTLVTETWKHSLHPVESNFILAEICISYLLLAVFETQPLGIGGLRFHDWKVKSIIEFYADKHVFLDYAAKNWAVHFRIAEPKQDRMLLNSAIDICDMRFKRFQTWFLIYSYGLSSLCTSRCDLYNIVYKDPKIFTNLMIASYFGYATMARILLVEKGADIAAKDFYERTALHWAALQGNDAIVQLLVDHGAELEARDRRGGTALYQAAREGHVDVIRVLVGAKANVHAKENYQYNGLHVAAIKNQQKVVQLLLDEGVDVNSQTDEGETALHFAARFASRELVELLLDRGADITMYSYAEGTALHEASSVKGQEAMTRFLMAKGACVRAVDIKGRTPLHMARDESIGRLLLEMGAEVDAKDNSGYTPLVLAQLPNRRSGKRELRAVVCLLIEAGADVTVRYTSPYVIWKQDQVTSENGSTTLHWAVERGDEVVTQLLLEKGADIKARDGNGRTALDIALRRKDMRVSELLLQYSEEQHCCMSERKQKLASCN